MLLRNIRDQFNLMLVQPAELMHCEGTWLSKIGAQAHMRQPFCFSFEQLSSYVIRLDRISLQVAI